MDSSSHRGSNPSPVASDAGALTPLGSWDFAPLYLSAPAANCQRFSFPKKLTFDIHDTHRMVKEEMPDLTASVVLTSNEMHFTPNNKSQCELEY